MLNRLHAIRTKTKKYIAERELCRVGDRVLVAVSGGADSVCCLHLLYSLRDELGIDVCAAHYDHSVRGAESAAEGDFTERLCGTLKIPCYRGKADTAQFAEGNFQDKARTLRYEFLLASAALAGANIIAVAHHADDQAETVLLHLLRGAGYSGLSGISPKNYFKGTAVIRPLLCLNRAETEEYCELAQMEFVTDPSNISTKYLRNKIRLELLPLLEGEYNSGIAAHLNAVAEISRAENEYMEALTIEAAGRLYRDYESGGLAKTELDELPLSLRRRLVRHVFKNISGEDLSYQKTEALLALKDGQASRITGDIWGVISEGNLYFTDKLPRDCV